MCWRPWHVICPISGPTWRQTGACRCSCTETHIWDSIVSLCPGGWVCKKKCKKLPTGQLVTKASSTSNDKGSGCVTRWSPWCHAHLPYHFPPPTSYYTFISFLLFKLLDNPETKRLHIHQTPNKKRLSVTQTINSSVLYMMGSTACNFKTYFWVRNNTILKLVLFSQPRKSDSFSLNIVWKLLLIKA